MKHPVVANPETPAEQPGDALDPAVNAAARAQLEAIRAEPVPPRLTELAAELVEALDRRRQGTGKTKKSTD